MKNQPKCNTSDNDDVQTPFPLALELAHHWSHFLLNKSVLEPCRWSERGNFWTALNQIKIENLDWCEVKEGRNFFDYDKNVDFIITNPPWSLLNRRKNKICFLEKSLQISNNVIFLATLNHLNGKKSSHTLIKKYGFHIQEIVYLDTPPIPWPASGFQLGCVYFKKGKTNGYIKETDLRGKINYEK